jgi:hypothetical protein
MRFWIVSMLALVVLIPVPITQAQCPSYLPSCMDQDGDAENSAGYSLCVARRSQGQQCKDVVTFYTAAGTLCANGCNSCASVNFSASCQCDSETLRVSGTCSYW